MLVAQCYTDKQTNIILVLALRTELCGIRRFGIRRFGLQWVVLIMGLSPKRRIPQSSVRRASTNIIFVSFSNLDKIVKVLLHVRYIRISSAMVTRYMSFEIQNFKVALDNGHIVINPRKLKQTLSRSKSLLKIVYVIFVISESHDFFCDFSAV